MAITGSRFSWPLPPPLLVQDRCAGERDGGLWVGPLPYRDGPELDEATG
ncbi:MAG: hypothetical protein MUC60_00730 [Oscillatoria sp. Prado101]|nr:hypothetical protein [Oscillatoria sp. Prado101]